jgi:hypothetical protein
MQRHLLSSEDSHSYHCNTIPHTARISPSRKLNAKSPHSSFLAQPPVGPEVDTRGDEPDTTVTVLCLPNGLCVERGGGWLPTK